MVSEQEIVNNKQNRSLTDAFKELQQARMSYEQKAALEKPKKHSKRPAKVYDVYYSGSATSKSKRNKAINQDKLSFKEWLTYRLNKLRYDRQEIKKLAFITTGVFAVCLTLISTNYIFAQYNKEEEIKQKIATNVFETNSESLDLEKILMENVEVTKSKTIVEDEEHEIDFEIQKKDNPLLPKGEEKVVQEGKIGIKLVDCIKTYQDNEFIEEKILNEVIAEKPTPQIIEVGTSEFLSKYQVHIGDKMYVTEDINLRKTASDTSDSLCIILDSLDVTLEDIKDNWCKIKYEDYTGYVKTSKLTSEAVTPGIGEQNRVQKIRATLDANMDLTKPSGLTLEDFEKVLSGNPNDTNKIIENNAKAFYEAEQKYKVNGIFLASMAIHESAWGTSKIAEDKKNLFGFGAYDRSPYESANTFEDYSNGIETVAKYLAKYYLNPSGTKIYDDEKAIATYYNGPTISGVNTKYCTDKDWATKIFKYMDYLYERI